MAFADVSPADAVAASAPLARLAGFVRSVHAAWRADRQRRLGLRAILSMPAHRLLDLGISIHDVMQAMDDPNGVYRK
jgi:uncharacterized protein YjiS (DUF1127 family)